MREVVGTTRVVLSVVLWPVEKYVAQNNVHGQNEMYHRTEYDNCGMMGMISRDPASKEAVQGTLLIHTPHLFTVNLSHEVTVLLQLPM